MSELATTHPTLMDLAAAMEPNGQIARVVEILSQTNEVLEDMVWQEGNLVTGNKTTIRTGIPEPTFRKLYGGVQPSKGSTVQVTDACGMLEAYAEADKALVDMARNPQAFRLLEDLAHIEGMNQKVSKYLIYGNEGSEPEAFTGLSPRYNSLSAENGQNIVSVASAGGGDAPASIWLVVWGPNTIHGIYPQGSKAGLQVTDKGQVTVENVDGNGGRMEAYRTHYRWDVGLTVRDWRYVVRGQFDYAELTKNAASGADLIDMMTEMLELPPSLSLGRPAFYMNRKTRSFLRRQITNKVANSTLTMDTVAGKRVLAFDGVPCRRVDQMLAGTETRVGA